MVAERRLAWLGMRRARYFGRVKTKFQLYLAATVANLTLLAGKAGRHDEKSAGPDHDGGRQRSAVDIDVYRRNSRYWQFRSLIPVVSAMLARS